MAEGYRGYLELMSDLGDGLDQLSALADRKIAAVGKDDLLALDEIMKQEQALALAFRGIEQRQGKLAEEFGWQGVPLSKVAAQFPPELREEALQATRTLQEKYAAYRERSNAARQTLESGIHEVDTMIAQLGGAPAPQPGGPGYGPAETAPPPQSMKTDFRA